MEHLETIAHNPKQILLSENRMTPHLVLVNMETKNFLAQSLPSLIVCARLNPLGKSESEIRAATFQIQFPCRLFARGRSFCQAGNLSAADALQMGRPVPATFHA